MKEIGDANLKSTHPNPYPRPLPLTICFTIRETKVTPKIDYFKFKNILTFLSLPKKYI